MNLQDINKPVSSPEEVGPVEPEMNELDPGPNAGAILPDEQHALAAPMPASAVGTGMPDETASPASSSASTSTSVLSLLDRADVELFCTRWNEIQGKFVDEPRAAVQQADTLIAEVVDKFTRKIVSEHSALHSQWNDSNDLSTEDLRKALLHYRAFFDRLVV